MRDHPCLRCLVALLGVIAIICLQIWHPQGMDAQVDVVSELMRAMSPDDKVGQLFVVTFRGSDTSAHSDIAKLIKEYRVGGVALLASQENFSNDASVPEQILWLTTELQELNRATASTPHFFVPLFVAVQSVGDGYPYTDITNGITSFPSLMALGATWQPNNALVIGEIAGQELSALGINMLFGPSLDVLNTPRLGLKGGIGTYSFGGDPFWVGQFGQAYIKGVHAGSKGQIITVAQHFPGLGAADRRPEEEVPTVPKSLSELRSIELVPFMAVTNANDPLTITDALMSSYIRYRGFKGNIRQLTRPISLDPQNLGMLISEPEFAKWRQNGGLMVTSALGVPAIRRYYDPQLQTFPFKRIAQDAFLAGNDLLYLYQYGLRDGDWNEQFANIKSTIEFFREKYVSDPDFQARVDESVGRILRAKYRMYDEFARSAVQRDDFKLDKQKRDAAAVEIARIARDAVTLIYPDAEDLAERIPAPPAPEDHILIFTDSREYQDCETCPTRPMIAPLALENIIVRLYGPNGSGQVSPERVHSLTFAQLKEDILSLSDPQVNSIADINSLINQADWIVFGMLDVDATDLSASDAIKTFLKLRPAILRDKKIIVMAYDAPYYLDTTEISKLTAYYGVYSKIGPSLEASVRSLFQEYKPIGNLPVSVEGVGYDLITQTAPDPDQTIELIVAGSSKGDSDDSVDITVGSELRLRTGVILDRNGHNVPDGTPVSFRLVYPSAMIELPRREVVTINGSAGTSIVVDHEGQMEITVSSDPATRSAKLMVNVRGKESVGTPSPFVPHPSVTTTSPLVAGMSSDGSQSVMTDSIPPSSDSSETSVRQTKPRVTHVDLLITLVGMVLLNALGDVLRLRGGRTRTYRFRLTLIGVLFGLIGYTIYALGILGTWGLWHIYQERGAILFGVSFSIIPLMIVLLAQGIRVTRHGH